jgi:hypothetical protein
MRWLSRHSRHWGGAGCRRRKGSPRRLRTRNAKIGRAQKPWAKGSQWDTLKYPACGARPSGRNGRGLLSSLPHASVGAESWVVRSQPSGAGVAAATPAQGALQSTYRHILRLLRYSDLFGQTEKLKSTLEAYHSHGCPFCLALPFTSLELPFMQISR